MRIAVLEREYLKKTPDGSVDMDATIAFLGQQTEAVTQAVEATLVGA